MTFEPPATNLREWRREERRSQACGVGHATQSMRTTQHASNVWKVSNFIVKLTDERKERPAGEIIDL